MGAICHRNTFGRHLDLPERNSVGKRVMTGIQTKPEPRCPDCGARMKLRRPRPNARTQFEPFWVCPQWPACRGVRQIGEDGKAEED